MAGELPQPLDELLELNGRDVLDIGCGAGRLARRLAAAGASVVGLDPSHAVLEQARHDLPAGAAVRYEHGEAQSLALPNASFDIAIFFNSLHHVPVAKMDAALGEAARVLRRDGVLYVQEPVPAGSAFELLRPVDDETDVRNRAREALTRASQGPFVSLARREVLLSVRHADFATLRARMVDVDPRRAAAFRECEPALRAAFERLGRAVEGGGLAFEQPSRVEVLGLAAARRDRERPQNPGG